MKEETPDAVWDIEGTKYIRAVPHFESLRKLGGDPCMPVGKEDGREGREHDLEVCEKIIEEMISVRKRLEPADTYIRFRINGEGTQSETASLWVRLENNVLSFKEKYHPSKVHWGFNPEYRQLEISEEKFKQIGLGHIIHKRLLRFKANMEQHFQKQKV